MASRILEGFLHRSHDLCPSCIVRTLTVVHAFTVASGVVNLRIATRHNLDTFLRISDKRSQVCIVVFTKVMSSVNLYFTTLTIGLYALTSNSF